MLWDSGSFLGYQKPPTTEGGHFGRDLWAAPRDDPRAKSVELIGFEHALANERQRFIKRGNKQKIEH